MFGAGEDKVEIFLSHLRSAAQDPQIFVGRTPDKDITIVIGKLENVVVGPEVQEESDLKLSGTGGGAEAGLALGDFVFAGE